MTHSTASILCIEAEPGDIFIKYLRIFKLRKLPAQVVEKKHFLHNGGQRMLEEVGTIIGDDMRIYLSLFLILYS